MDTEQPSRIPVLYLSHGAPPLADDPIWPGQLAAWSARLPKPIAVLMISARWGDAPVAVGATETIPLMYNFRGLPQHYYEVRYPAPPSSLERCGSWCADREIRCGACPTAAWTTARMCRS